LINPAHAIDWVSRFPNHATVRIGIAPVEAKIESEARGSSEPDQEAHAPAPEIAEAAEEKFAQCVSEHTQGGDIAEPDDRLIAAHAATGQILDDERRSDGEIGSAEIRERHNLRTRGR
jgi:hypothetical protein